MLLKPIAKLCDWIGKMGGLSAIWATITAKASAIMSSLGGVMTAIKGAFVALAGALGISVGWLAAIVAAIVAVIAAGVALWKNWDKVCEWAKKHSAAHGLTKMEKFCAPVSI